MTVALRALYTDEYGETAAEHAPQSAEAVEASILDEINCGNRERLTAFASWLVDTEHHYTDWPLLVAGGLRYASDVAREAARARWDSLVQQWAAETARRECA